jgi:hypothetical protein
VTASWIAALLVHCLAGAGGCGPSIAEINGIPDRHYDKEVGLHGRVDDILVRDGAGKALVFHLVSKEGHRMIVVSPTGADFRNGDKVRVHGTFTMEYPLGERRFYDVVVADSVRRGERRFRIPYL